MYNDKCKFNDKTLNINKLFIFHFLFLAILSLDYLFTENGIVSYHGEELLQRKTIQEHLGEERVQELIDFCLGYISKLRLPFKRGHFIDYRTGIINVSPVGRACTLDERKMFIEYDQVSQ